jgi:hypothetical protein
VREGRGRPQYEVDKKLPPSHTHLRTGGLTAVSHAAELRTLPLDATPPRSCRPHRRRVAGCAHLRRRAPLAAKHVFYPDALLRVAFVCRLLAYHPSAMRFENCSLVWMCFCLPFSHRPVHVSTSLVIEHPDHGGLRRRGRRVACR